MRRPRLHPDRAAGRHRDHRRPDRPAAARRPGGAARRPGGSQCVNNLKQIGLAIHNYDEHPRLPSLGGEPTRPGYNSDPVGPVHDARPTWSSRPCTTPSTSERAAPSSGTAPPGELDRPGHEGQYLPLPLRHRAGPPSPTATPTTRQRRRRRQQLPASPRRQLRRPLRRVRLAIEARGHHRRHLEHRRLQRGRPGIGQAPAPTTRSSPRRSSPRPTRPPPATRRPTTATARPPRPLAANMSGGWPLGRRLVVGPVGSDALQPRHDAQHLELRLRQTPQLRDSDSDCHHGDQPPPRASSTA